MSTVRSGRQALIWNRRVVACLALLTVGYFFTFALASWSADVPGLAEFALGLPIGWMVVASFLTSLSSRKLDVILAEPRESVRALSVVQLTVRLHNAKRWAPSLFLTIRCRVESSQHALWTIKQFVGALEAGQSEDFAWRVTIRERGFLQISRCHVIAEFPGSLFQKVQELETDYSQLVLPAACQLMPAVLELLVGRRQAPGRMRLVPSAIEEFAGAREYRPGDNPRLIHRVLSLRAPGYPSQFIIREFEDPTDDDACIVLDSAILPTDSAIETLHWRYEKAIAFTAELAKLFVQRKYRVRFVTTSGADGRRLELSLAPRATEAHVLDEVLALVQPTNNRRPLQEILDQESRRSRSALLFISLREIREERRQPRLSTLTITPDCVHLLLEKVEGV